MKGQLLLPVHNNSKYFALQFCKATNSAFQIAAAVCHIISEGKLLHNFLFYLFLKTHNIGDFAHLVTRNSVSHTIDRKTYTDISSKGSKGGPALFCSK